MLGSGHFLKNDCRFMSNFLMRIGGFEFDADADRKRHGLDRWRSRRLRGLMVTQSVGAIAECCGA
jgi:hypothetical protein